MSPLSLSLWFYFSLYKLELTNASCSIKMKWAQLWDISIEIACCAFSLFNFIDSSFVIVYVWVYACVYFVICATHFALVQFAALVGSYIDSKTNDHISHHMRRPAENQTTWHMKKIRIQKSEAAAVFAVAPASKDLTFSVRRIQLTCHFVHPVFERLRFSALQINTPKL